LVIQEEYIKGGHKVLNVNKKHLEGLVGFDSGRIQRPGLLIHLFEENDDLHGDYNRQVEAMVQAALAQERSIPSPTKTSSLASSVKGGAPSSWDTSNVAAEVSVHGFGSGESEAVHHSLQVLKAGAPLDKTVLFTVDEFWQSTGKEAEQTFARIDTTEILGPDDKLVVDKYEQYRRKGKMVAWPYYLNVLLLAYRKDVCDDPRALSSWSSINNMLGKFRKSSHNNPSIRRPFWFDVSAPETLSCMLMDVLITGDAQDNPGRQNLPIDEILFPQGKQKLGRKQKQEIVALYNLFQKTDWEHQKDKKLRKVLPADSAVYVCWYSQLRELLNRERRLARLLTVRALPGGGFKGDWFMGIVRGSVSVELGANIIQMLCSKEEEYKRFARGVGLPVRKSFYEKRLNFYPWRRGLDVRVPEILRIHRGAHSRSDIPHYERIRSQLYTVAWQLTPLSGPLEDIHGKASEIIERIFPQVEMLRG
jgi:hypothetical protein